MQISFLEERRSSRRIPASLLRQLFEGKLIVSIDADFCSDPHGFFSDDSGIQLRMLEQDTSRRQSIVSTRPDGDEAIVRFDDISATGNNQQVVDISDNQ